MNLIKTKSFELAINSRGNESSDKLAIVLPGRLDTKDYECFTKHIEYLASKGFLAISFDPPGTWESPGGTELFTTTNYIKAVNELIEYFGNKPTLLIGHSRGATVSILAGAQNPAVKAFVPIMSTYGTLPLLDEEAIKKGFKVSHRDLPPGTAKTTEQKEFVLPLRYFQDAQKYNVVDVLKQSTKPKLFFYGTDDEFTEQAQVKEVFKIIPGPKFIHELDTNHDYRYHQEIIEEVNKVLGDFLDKYPDDIGLE